MKENMVQICEEQGSSGFDRNMDILGNQVDKIWCKA